MNFDLHLYGETPEELLNVLAHLGHMDSNYHTPIPDERHPAQAPAPQSQSTPAQQPQSEPVTQSDKPKAQTPTKPKKPAQKPAAAPVEEPANPTTAEASDSPSQADAAPANSTSAPESEPAAEPDPVVENKIRTLVMALMNQGKRAECQKIITSTGAKGISSLPPSSYTSVWEELLKLKDGVDANASN